jgi:hypothetical protein
MDWWLKSPQLLVAAPPAEAIRSVLTGVRGSDLLFVLTALAFELLIIGILIAQKRQHHVLLKILGGSGCCWWFRWRSSLSATSSIRARHCGGQLFRERERFAHQTTTALA